VLSLWNNSESVTFIEILHLILEIAYIQGI
jgi:hypothetical protein